MTTTLILIGIGVALLVAICAVLFSRARKIRERGTVSRAIAAVQKAEDSKVGVPAKAKTEAPRVVAHATPKAPIIFTAPATKPDVHVLGEPTGKTLAPEYLILTAAERSERLQATLKDKPVVGTVVKVDGSRVEIRGLGRPQQMEILEFPNRVEGVVSNSSEDKVEALVVEHEKIKEGDLVKRTGRLFNPFLTDTTAKRTISADWRSNSFSSGSPDRSESGGRM